VELQAVTTPDFWRDRPHPPTGETMTAATPAPEIPAPPAEPLKLWSVTTLIKQGLGESGSLVGWKVSTTAKTAVKDHTIVSAMLERGDTQAAIAHIRGASDRHARRRAEEGTLVHAAFEALALGQQAPPLPQELEPYRAQYDRWLAHFQPEFLLAETPVYNITHRYAGTLDGILRLGDHRLLFDYKTTEHAPDSGKQRPPFTEVALQLAAYKHAEEVGLISEQRYASWKRYYLYNPDQAHEPMPQVDGALCIVVSPYDCNAHAIAVHQDVWEGFLDVCEAARWQLTGSRGVIGPALTALTRTEAV
jgi:hypothetical protein